MSEITYKDLQSTGMYDLSYLFNVELVPQMCPFCFNLEMPVVHFRIIGLRMTGEATKVSK